MPLQARKPATSQHRGVTGVTLLPAIRLQSALKHQEYTFDMLELVDSGSAQA